MNNEKSTEICLRDILSLVYQTVGEGSPEVDAFIDLPGYNWLEWANDKSRVLSLIRDSASKYMGSLTSESQVQLKKTLQYLLNADASVPYEAWNLHPELKQKKAGVGHALFMSFQDTIVPYDWYQFCIWMWEALYGEEDWRADVRHWRVVELSLIRE